MLQNINYDEQLIGKLKNGDTVAYEHLYDLFWQKLYKHVLIRIRDEEASKDIVQTIFINLWERRDKISVETTLEQFLFGAAKLQVLNYFRSEKADEKLLSHTLQKLKDVSTPFNELDAYLEMEKLIDVEVNKLPDNMRNAYLLKQGHSTKQIAEKLNLAEQTVSNHISEATRRIRLRLKEKLIGG